MNNLITHLFDYLLFTEGREIIRISTIFSNVIVPPYVCICIRYEYVVT